jgi:hypothetical protein
MARPQPDIIISTQLSDTIEVDILEAERLWVILYQNKPFGIRKRYWTANGEFNKYIRTTFPHKKSAENLAERLNEYFITNEFVVEQLI